MIKEGNSRFLGVIFMCRLISLSVSSICYQSLIARVVESSSCKYSYKFGREMDHSKFYENVYRQKNPVDFLDGRLIREEMMLKIRDLDQMLFSKIKKVIENIGRYREHSVYTGYSGITYLCLFKFKKTNDTTYLQLAKGISDRALQCLNRRDVSFLLGDAGPLTLGAIIYSKINKPEECNACIKSLLELLKLARHPPYEVLYGYAGYLYSLLYLNNEIGVVIPASEIKLVVRKILDDGRHSAESRGFSAPLYYEWYDTNYLGAAHGTSGILYMLLCANEYLTKGDREELIKPTIDWLTTQRFPSGNFKANEGRDRDSLVHWCHGAPGVIYLYLIASKVFQNKEYLRIAKECGEVVWQRGILRKGYSICHGVSGNAYAFLQLYKETGDVEQLGRAVCFADWCTRYPQDEGHKPDSPYSLFEGIAGLDYFITDIQDPSNSSFPAFALN